ncbi:MAG TPA: hypothetical protein V6C95_00235 [Coleofasciculaceae cyanobacterium]
MLENLSRDPPFPSKLNTEASLIPDPWETPKPTLEYPTIPVSWKLPQEPRPLISPTIQLNVPQLSAPKALSEPDPTQVLLQDRLKLKRGDCEKVLEQIRDALALLYWMGLETQRSRPQPSLP